MAAYGRTTMTKEEPYPNGYDGCTDNEPLSWDALYEGMVCKPISKDSHDPFEVILKAEDIALIDSLERDGERRTYEFIDDALDFSIYTEVTDGSVEPREVEERPPIEEREINGPYSLQERHSGCEREHFYWVFRGEEPLTTWKELEEGSYYSAKDRGHEPPLKVVRKGEEVMIYCDRVNGNHCWRKEDWQPFAYEPVTLPDESYIYSDV